MTALEIYLFLFCDSFFAAFIIPTNNEMVIYALSIFGGHNKFLILLIALLGSVSGSAINWWIGKKLRFLQQQDFFQRHQNAMTIAKNKWEKYLVWFLLTSPFKVTGNPLTLLAGFFATNFTKFLLIVTTGKIIFYIWTVFYL